MLELMLAVGVMGVLMALMAVLVKGGGDAWLLGFFHSQAQRGARSAQDFIERHLGEAQAHSVVISRTAATEDPFSLLDFVDAQGNTFVYWKDKDKLWASMTKMQGGHAVTQMHCLVEQDLKRFTVYYPNLKDYSVINTCVLIKRDQKNFKRPIVIQVDTSTQLRNP